MKPGVIEITKQYTYIYIYIYIIIIIMSRWYHGYP